MDAGASRWRIPSRTDATPTIVLFLQSFSSTLEICQNKRFHVMYLISNQLEFDLWAGDTDVGTTHMGIHVDSERFFGQPVRTAGQGAFDDSTDKNRITRCGLGHLVLYF
jgi:hypothetical protein